MHTKCSLLCSTPGAQAEVPLLLPLSVQGCGKSEEECKRSQDMADNEYADYTGAFQCMVSALLCPLGRAPWLSVQLGSGSLPGTSAA